MNIGYARVSSRDQNLDRQLKALANAGVNERNIYTDKASGKNFNRESYQWMIEHVLREGDCLIIYSIDRLGRNYSEIREQWEYITHNLKCDICVLDMPLLDTRNGSQGNLDRRFISDLVLQILSYVAERERQNINARQKQGYAAMDRDAQGRHISKRTGRHVGRQEIQKPVNWDEVYCSWKSGKIKAVEAMRLTGLKKNTFYKLAKAGEIRDAK